jgi:calreticulin
MFGLLVLTGLAEVFFEERFNRGWEKRWVKSSRGSPDKLLGRFRVSAGEFYADRRMQRGLQTLDDNREYLISSKFKRCFNTSGRDLIFQFTVKLENKVEKAQTFFKLMPESFKPNQFSKKSAWHILFGPDFRQWTRKHIDFRMFRNRTEWITVQPLTAFEDRLTHCYTLAIFANQTYRILKDNFTDIESHLEEAFTYASPRMIPDPAAMKPADWEDIEEIDDPDDVPPWEGTIPKFIPDASAKRPDDWDDAVAGAWTPPLVDNPAYNTQWKPRRIPNPAFRGDWIAQNVSNSDYVPDAKFGKPEDLCYVALDVEQDVAGAIWDNILVTDDWHYAQKMMDETFLSIQDGERNMWRQYELKKKEMEKAMQEPVLSGGASSAKLPSYL